MAPFTPTATRLEITDGPIALLTLDQPGSRANTLGQAVFGELGERVRELAARTELTGLILCSGKPGMFIAGADLKELGGAKPDAGTARAHGPRRPRPRRRSGSVAVPDRRGHRRRLHGRRHGVIARLRLSHRRLDPEDGNRLAGNEDRPDPRLGRYPTADAAHRPIVGGGDDLPGEAAKAPRARQLGIVFDVVPSEPSLEEARATAAMGEAVGRLPRNPPAKEAARRPDRRTNDGFTFAVLRAQVAAKTGGQYPAPLAALDAIAKGCNLPLEDGLKAETEAFLPLVGSPISRNLIAVFFMTQRLQKDPGVADAPVKPRDVGQVGVVGAGIMGAGIAGANVRRGVPALLIDAAPAALEKGVGGRGEVAARPRRDRPHDDPARRRRRWPG